MHSLTPETIDKVLSLAHQPLSVEIHGRHFVLTPNGWSADDVTQKLRFDEPHPRERRGTVILRDIGSLVDFVNRMRTPPTTVLFANHGEKKITAIFDFHDPLQWPDAHKMEAVVADGDEAVELIAPPDGKPRWGRYRALYEFPVSRQWKIWTDQEGKAMGQGAFASFIEDNLMDVLPGPDGDPGIEAAVHQLGLIVADPARLLGNSRSLKINADETIVNTVNLNSGEVEIVYQNRQNATDAGTGERIIIPTAFVIAIPVFEGGAAYRLLVRLRTRKQEGQVRWSFDIYQRARSEHDAFATECASISRRTATPLFYGVAPEAAAA